MVIPKSFTLSGADWRVRRVPFIGSLYGSVSYAARYIIVHDRPPATRNAARKEAQTFWHEATHAILHDMGHKLRDDEKFVEAFSQRLNELVHTAKLP